MYIIPDHRSLPTSTIPEPSQTFSARAWRFAVGAPVSGRVTTDATFLRPASRALTHSGHASRWAKLPGWKRSAWRLGTIAVSVGGTAGYVTHPLATAATAGAATIAGTSYGAVRARRWARSRRHMRTVVRPLAAVLAPVLGVPETELRRTMDVPGTVRVRPRPLGSGAEEDAEDDDMDTGPDQAVPTVTVPIPDDFGARRTEVETLLRQRLPGRWAFRWEMDAAPFRLVGRKVPTPPRRVEYDHSAVRKAISRCKPGEIVIGLDSRHRAVVRPITGESGHWALSVGSGGGKSSFLYFVLSQLAEQGATLLVLDVKRASLAAFAPAPGFAGVPGIHVYNDPDNGIGDMRDAIAWLRAETDARTYLKNQDPSRAFPRLVLVLEEGNEAADIFKEFHADQHQGKKVPPDPVWRDVAAILRMGRHVDVSVIGVFQDLRDSAVGGRGLRNLFPLLIMGQYKARQWAMLSGTAYVPCQRGAGRMVLLEGDSHTWIQVPYATPERYRDECLTARAAQGYTENHLFGRPPERSPEAVPELLREADVTLSRPASDPAFPGSGNPQVGDLPGFDLIGAVTRDSGRDRLHLVRDAEPETPPQRRVSLAQAAREGIVPLSADALRQAKRRASDFPAADADGLYDADDLREWSANRSNARAVGNGE